jgi:hypothetical protein
MVSIVMIVKDRHRLTAQALESLYAHTDRESFNLTVVDDGSTDFRTGRVLGRLFTLPNATLLTINKSSHIVARAKNIGVAWSKQTFGKGDWLYLSDNDVYFMEDWLPQMIQIAESSEPESFSLWGGQIHPFHQPVLYGEEHRARMREYKILDGPSWLMRWDTWSCIGGLQSNTAPGPCQSEEYPFCKALTDFEWRIGVIEPHVVLHTGLTNTDGKDAPGRKEREAHRASGVLYE